MSNVSLALLVFWSVYLGLWILWWVGSSFSGQSEPKSLRQEIIDAGGPWLSAASELGGVSELNTVYLYDILFYSSQNNPEGLKELQLLECLIADKDLTVEYQPHRGRSVIRRPVSKEG